MMTVGQALGDRTITVREDKAPAKAAGKKHTSVVLSEAPAGGEGCRCYFGNLAWETTEEMLMAHCASFGVNVAQCEVARQHGGRSKGWALVDFATPDEASNAIAQMHNSEIQGRSIIVRVERPGAGAKSARVETRPENSSGLQIVVRNLPWTTTSKSATSSTPRRCATRIPAAPRAGVRCSLKPASKRKLRSKVSTASSSSTARCKSSLIATIKRRGARARR
jgi:RNA recognition motif-containing protein